MSWQWAGDWGIPLALVIAGLAVMVWIRRQERTLEQIEAAKARHPAYQKIDVECDEAVSS